MRTQTPSAAPASDAPGASYWNALSVGRFGGLWRLHADGINRRLLGRWLGSHRGRLCVKTDAFDEAVGEGPLLIPGAAYDDYLLLDCAENILSEAKLRHPAFQVVACDARDLPLPPCADAVVSLSTLDHFSSEADLRRSLSEIHRILRPGGKFVITMDNPVNPVVWIRNWLPRAVREGSSLVPYFVGYTAAPATLGQILSETGFTVLASTALMHCPRVAAIPLCSLVQRLPGSYGRFLLSILGRFEWLERFPTRYFTGHFTAHLAEKPAQPR